MIKVLIIILCVATLASLPYLFAFASGNDAQNAQGVDKMFGSYSLGNIGQSTDMCTTQDINTCDTVNIKCPNHTRITSLRAFGI